MKAQFRHIHAFPCYFCKRCFSPAVAGTQLSRWEAARGEDAVSSHDKSPRSAEDLNKLSLLLKAGMHVSFCLTQLYLLLIGIACAIF